MKKSSLTDVWSGEDTNHEHLRSIISMYYYYYYLTIMIGYVGAIQDLGKPCLGFPVLESFCNAIWLLLLRGLNLYFLRSLSSSSNRIEPGERILKKPAERRKLDPLLSQCLYTCSWSFTTSTRDVRRESHDPSPKRTLPQTTFLTRKPLTLNWA